MFTLIMCGAVASLANPPIIVINAPSHLRQIEILQNPLHGVLIFNLANAGFRDLHKHHLLAIVTGAARWRVTWQSNDAATVSLRPMTAQVTQFSVPGFQIKFTN